MDFKPVLAADGQGPKAVPLVTAKNLSINFNGAGMQGGADNMGEGNFSISGELEFSVGGKVVTTPMPQISKRLAELSKVVAAMADGPEKDKAKAELANWEAMMEGIRQAVGTALVKNYEITNPDNK